MQDNNKTNFDEENLEYLRSYLGGETVEDFLAFYEEKRGKVRNSKNVELVMSFLITMAVAKDNRWWKSPDPRMRAYYQSHCKLWIISYPQFEKDLEILLGRKVSLAEFMVSRKAIMKEVKEAFNAPLEEKAEDWF